MKLGLGGREASPELEVGRRKEVKPVVGRRDDGSLDLLVPVDLLDVLLALVDEQQLRRNVRRT